MAIATIIGCEPVAISKGWQLALMAPDAISSPDALPRDLLWHEASVPGTVAQALASAGLWQPADPAPLHDKDVWYRVRFEGTGQEILRFHGLATLATVWLNGREILVSRNMFHAHDVPVSLAGENSLHICLRSLTSELAKPMPPGRWRPRMIQPSALRHVRTTVLGHMAGWCPPVDVIGPWRAVERVKPTPLSIQSARMRASLEGDSGVLDVTLTLNAGLPATGTLQCAGSSVPLVRDKGQTYKARLSISNVEKWWPHTHGKPALHEVTAHFGCVTIDLGRTGFRTIQVDRGDDGHGFGLIVNGVNIFCRGAVWSSADLVSLPGTRAAYEPWLKLARDANMNMIRVPGTTVYEADTFYQLCDELGILVWQDFMFANFDYPAGDDAFAASVQREAAHFLDRTQSSPSLAVLCGGSEVYQQAAMLGLPEKKYLNPLFETWLPALAHDWRADVPYVAGSPSGGALPFVVDEGVGHYFGVGGYRRPLNDARSANVRFAAECLAFANVPPEITAPAFEAPLTGIEDPRWKSRVARDAGSDWDFEDVRDHYLEQIFGVTSAELREQDAKHYLELSRAAVASVFESVLADWTRAASPARGALALMLQDLQPGAGWGLITSCGRPKSPWYAFKRAFAPVRVALTDEGVNGLCVHVTNELAGPRNVILTLTALRSGKTRVLNMKHTLALAPRSTQTLSAFRLLGSFFDLNYAYRFQPPQHDTVIAALNLQETGDILSEAIYFPCGHSGVVPETSLSALVEEEAGSWVLQIQSERLARFVHIADPCFRCEDDWFHLTPGRPRRLRLTSLNPANMAARPRGWIRALNLTMPVPYEAPA